MSDRDPIPSGSLVPLSTEPGSAEFMQLYGEALAEWGAVEHALSRVFLSMIGAKHTVVGGKVYFAVSNFRDRLNMVDTGVREYVHNDIEGIMPNKDLEAEWNSLKLAIQRTAKHRNKIAHMHVWVSHDFGIFGSADLWSLPDRQTGEDPDRIFITPKRLKDFRQAFDSLWRRIDAFNQSYFVLRSSHTRFPVEDQG